MIKFPACLGFIYPKKNHSRKKRLDIKVRVAISSESFTVQMSY